MRYVKNSHEHHKKAMEGLEKRLMPLLSVKYGTHLRENEVMQTGNIGSRGWKLTRTNQSSPES